MSQVSYGTISITDLTDIYITGRDVVYAISSSGTSTPTEWPYSDVPSVSEGDFLWTKTTVTYSDGEYTESISVGYIGTNGDDGTSVSISSSEVKYQAGTSGTSAPTGDWLSSVPTVAQGSYLWTRTIVNYSDGTSTTSYSVSRQGSDGYNNATVYLYQYGTSAPSVPSSNLTYTFSTGALSGSLGNWTQTVPSSGDGQCYVTAATATSNSTTDTISSSEWSTPIQFNGTNGTDGLNQATIFIYQRSATAPSAPSSVTYTFSSGSFSVPSGWSKTVPTSDGNPCYVTTGVAIGDGATATVTFAAPTKMVENGEDAYTVNLSNENHTFPGTVSTAVNNSTAACVITAYKGATQTTLYVGSSASSTSITTGVEGLTCSIGNNNSKNVTLTFTATSSLTTQNGTVTIPVVVDGITFNKLFTFSVAFIGADGDDGDDGKMLYATCSTSASTQTKVAYLSPYDAAITLYSGLSVSVKFTNKNTYVDGVVKLNLYTNQSTSLGAANIYYNNAVTSQTNIIGWESGAIITFIYNGSYWYISDNGTMGSVYREQRIYYRSDSSTKPSAPTTWVTTTDNAYNGWTTKVTPAAESTERGKSYYQYLYTCLQRQTMNQSGTNICTTSTVVLDETTTVINGSLIVKNSITAEQINASTITVGSLSDGSDYSTTSEITSQMNEAIADSHYIRPNLLSFSDVNLYTTTSNTIDKTDFLDSGSFIHSRDAAKNGGFYICNWDKLSTSTTYTLHLYVTETTDTKVIENIFLYSSAPDWIDTIQIYFDGSLVGSADNTTYAADLTDGERHEIMIVFTTVSEFSSSDTITYNGPILQFWKNHAEAYSIYVENMKLEEGDYWTPWGINETETYITAIDDTGINVHSAYDETDYLHIDSGNIGIYTNDIKKLEVTDSGLTFYDGSGTGSTNIAASINTAGLNIKKGTIQLGSKTAASDTTNTGFYVDSNGDMIVGDSSQYIQWYDGNLNIALDNLTIGGVPIQENLYATNMLLDTNAPSTSPVVAGYHRYFSNSSGNNATYIKTSYISISDPPDDNIYTSRIAYGARFVCTAAGYNRHLTFYQNGLVPVVDGETYTASCYARCTDGTASQFVLQIGTTTGHYKSYYSNATIGSDWTRISITFTYSSAYGSTGGTRMYFGIKSKVGTTELCGFQLERGTICTAWTPSYDETAQFAKKYLVYDANTGLQIGTESTINGGRNVLITDSEVQVRNDSTILAKFGEETIIGDTSLSAIYLTDDTISGVGLNGVDFFIFSASGRSQDASVRKTNFLYITAGETYNIEFENAANAGTNPITLKMGGSADYVSATFVYGTQNTTDLTYENGGVSATITYDGGTSFGIYINSTSSSRVTVTISTTITTYTPTYIMGENCSVEGAYSVAEGSSHTVVGNYSHAEGKHVFINRAYAHGGGSEVTIGGDYSFAHGLELTTNAAYQAVFGKYNNVSSNDLLELGYGTSTSPANIFSVNKSGNVISTGYMNPSYLLLPNAGAVKSLDSSSSEKSMIEMNSNDSILINNDKTGGVYIYGPSTASTSSGIHLGTSSNPSYLFINGKTYGSTASATLSSTSVTTGTWTNIGSSISLSKGVYLVAANATFPSFANAHRFLRIAVGGSGLDHTTTSTSNNSTSRSLQLSTVGIVTITSDNTAVTVQAWQNSGSSKNISGSIYYLSLGNPQPS